VRSVSLVLVVLALAACGGSELPPLEGGEPLELPTHPESEDGPAAEVGGDVVFVEEPGCVFVEAYGERIGLVWPEDTRATRDPFRVMLSDGRVIREGDRVTGSGGGDPGGYGPNGCDAVVDRVDLLNWADDIVIRQAAG
jgi:hypothetical protein